MVNTPSIRPYFRVCGIWGGTLRFTWKENLLCNCPKTATNAPGGRKTPRCQFGIAPGTQGLSKDSVDLDSLQYLVVGFQPIWKKYDRIQIGSFPQFSGWKINKKIFENTTWAVIKTQCDPCNNLICFASLPTTPVVFAPNFIPQEVT